MTEELRLQPRLQLLADLGATGRPVWPMSARITATCRCIFCKKGRIASAIAADIGAGALGARPAYGAAVRRGGCSYALSAVATGCRASARRTRTRWSSPAWAGRPSYIFSPRRSWTRKAGSTLLLLQPMTKQEELRRWLNENGYAQCAERLVQDKEYLYPIFTVYGGPQPPLSVAEIYGGVDIEVDPLAREYLTQRIRRLEQAEQGLAKSSAGENHLQSRELGRIKQALIERRAQL